MQKNKKYALYILAVFGAFLAVTTLRHRTEFKDLAGSKSFATGVITEFRRRSKGGGVVYYEYRVGSQEISDFKGYGKISDEAKNLVGKKFMVVYNKEKIQSNDILLNEEDYKSYDIIFPDSLHWIQQIFK